VTRTLNFRGPRTGTQKVGKARWRPTHRGGRRKKAHPWGGGRRKTCLKKKRATKKNAHQVCQTWLGGEGRGKTEGKPEVLNQDQQTKPNSTQTEKTPYAKGKKKSGTSPIAPSRTGKSQEPAKGGEGDRRTKGVQLRRPEAAENRLHSPGTQGGDVTIRVGDQSEVPAKGGSGERKGKTTVTPKRKRRITGCRRKNPGDSTIFGERKKGFKNQKNNENRIRRSAGQNNKTLTFQAEKKKGETNAGQRGGRQMRPGHGADGWAPRIVQGFWRSQTKKKTQKATNREQCRRQGMRGGDPVNFRPIIKETAPKGAGGGRKSGKQYAIGIGGLTKIIKNVVEVKKGNSARGEKKTPQTKLRCGVLKGEKKKRGGGGGVSDPSGNPRKTREKKHAISKDRGRDWELGEEGDFSRKKLLNTSLKEFRDNLEGTRKKGNKGAK